MQNKIDLSQEETHQIDITQKARQDIIEQLQEMKEDSGWVGGEKAILLLLNYIVALEKQLAVFCSDFTTLVEVIAKTQVSHFGLRTNVKALVRDLCKKNITTEEELFSIHQKEIVPEELPEEQREEYLKAYRAMEEAAKAQDK